MLKTLNILLFEVTINTIVLTCRAIQIKFCRIGNCIKGNLFDGCNPCMYSIYDLNITIKKDKGKSI